MGEILVGDGSLAVAGVETDIADGTGIAMAILEGDELGLAVGVEQEKRFGPLRSAATLVAEACVAGQSLVEVIDEDLAVGEEGEQVLAEDAGAGAAGVSAAAAIEVSRSSCNRTSPGYRPDQGGSGCHNASRC